MAPVLLVSGPRSTASGRPPIIFDGLSRRIDESVTRPFLIRAAMECAYYTNDSVEAFHEQLRGAGIVFPVPMDADHAVESASWAKSLFLSGKIGK